MPSIAGPKRPQDRISLSGAQRAWRKTLAGIVGDAPRADDFVAGTERPVPAIHGALATRVPVETDRGRFELTHGAVVIAAITSCTNTSNPAVMLAAGLVAKKAAARGLSVPPWVKTSLAPGSQVVTEYLDRAELMKDFEALGFYLVGYGCTTCIGNSGPVHPAIVKAVSENKLAVASVLSGNRNFEGRVSPVTLANYLASPPLVVAYALAGTTDIDFASQPVGRDAEGKDVYLRDLWPSPAEVSTAIREAVQPEMFEKRYAQVFEGTDEWRALAIPEGRTFAWDESSTYIRRPPFFDDLGADISAPGDIEGARCLALLGDSVTTDHISPAGAIKPSSPAGRYLQEQGVDIADFNSYGSRRGNHEVMVRGTFANIRLRNQLAPGTEGSVTRYFPGGEEMSIYDASMRYQSEGVPLIVLAGKEYGTGSSRDWAAKGTLLLGVAAVIAESYERIHRSNLVGMGVLPLQFAEGDSAVSLELGGDETFAIRGLRDRLAPGMRLQVSTDSGRSFDVICRVDTPQEVEYIKHGGILPYVLRTSLAR